MGIFTHIIGGVQIIRKIRTTKIFVVSDYYYYNKKLSVFNSLRKEFRLNLIC